MKCKSKTYSGSLNADISKRELENRNIARQAAAESIVLLKNDGLLPLAKGTSVALYGSGALHFVKGGTGSGDVNERDVVSIDTGMKNAGFVIANEAWLTDYEREYQKAHGLWKEMILELAAKNPEAPESLNLAYARNAFVPPVGRGLTEAEAMNPGADTAVYLLSRKAGESADRKTEQGDYYVADEEAALMKSVRASYAKFVLVLNCGGPIDLSFLDNLNVNAIVQLSQPGMEGGNAFADIIGGDAVPCGKMTDTWAFHYEDYPSASGFGKDATDEYYTEGIYVGYRYFDTFGVAARFSFGFGLSYAEFSVKTTGFALTDAAPEQPKIAVTVQVCNTGAVYAGKEVVQIYASCPQGKLKKEYRRLCAFGKTRNLAPGESCTLELSFPLYQLASFSEADSAYIMEQGNYVVTVGNSSANTSPVGVISLDKTVNLLRVEHICPLQKNLTEIEPQSVPAIDSSGVPVIELKAETIKTQTANYSENKSLKFYDEAKQFVERLTLEQILSLTSGDPNRAQYSSGELPSGLLCVPGSAAETHNCAVAEPWNLASIVLADGPAGLRLFSKYQITPEGNIVKPSFTDSIERGLFAKQEEIKGSAYRYQYCTAFPVGTMLAQSWDTDLMYRVGQAVAVEMEEFGVSLLLSPGMNIHRNPLSGRNYEYYSEDPLLTGMLASALVSGVQSGKGTGATIKHFACNHRENNRKQSDSVVSERALREIYLHGFEIAVKHAQPMSIMTSYNLLNGVHTANSSDLIAKAARGEWGFEGVVMTDWVTTGIGGSSPIQCMTAGNDMIMPGDFEDIEILRNALQDDGSELKLEHLQQCAANIVRIIWQSLEYEGCESYSGQFSEMSPFVECVEALL
jgi:beta-glucosidase